MENLRLVDSDMVEARPSIGASRKVLGAAAAVGLFCAGGWAGEHFSARGPAMQSHAGEDLQDLAQIIAMPKRETCSKMSEDCFATGCCDVVGYNCFTTKPGKAQCLKNCTPSATQSCTQPQGIMDPILQDAVPVGQTMYCFSVYTKDTGSSKPSYELEILQHQKSQNLGIFQCDYSAVFSDVSVEVGGGMMTTVVTDVEGDWHFAKRKTSGTWINTGMFTQIWKKIAEAGEYQNADWVLKLDADAIFIANRMKVWLKHNELVPPPGIYLENCKYVDYGYFGNLEVYSTQAFSTLVQNIDSCKQTLNWKVGVKDGKYGPMGEDLFAQRCLDSVGVRRKEAFDITTDGACPADRPKDEKKNKKWKPNCAWVATPAMHPFKKTQEWIQCYEATTAAFGA